MNRRGFGHGRGGGGGVSFRHCLQVASCASALPFEDAAASCPTTPGAVPVCITAGQLLANGTLPGSVAPPNATLPLPCNESQTFFHQFFPGETQDGAISRQDETVDQMSQAAGGKVVSVVDWVVVVGEGASSPAAAGGGRRLTQVADDIGVMGYFLVEGGDVADLRNIVERFSGIGETVDENGRPILSQRQVCLCLCLFGVNRAGGVDRARSGVAAAVTGGVSCVCCGNVAVKVWCQRRVLLG